MFKYTHNDGRSGKGPNVIEAMWKALGNARFYALPRLLPLAWRYVQFGSAEYETVTRRSGVITAEAEYLGEVVEMKS